MRVTRIEIFGFKSFIERTVLPLDGGIAGVVGPNGCGKSNIVDALRWVLGESKASALRGQLIEDVIFNGTDSLRPLGLAEVSLTIRAHEASLWDDLFKYGSFPTSSSALDSFDPECIENSPANNNQTGQDVDPSPRFRIIQGKLSRDDSRENDQSEFTDEPYEGTALQSNDLESAQNRFSWLKTLNEIQITRRLYRSGEAEFFINRVQCRLRDIKELVRALGINARGYTVVAQGEVTRIISAKPDERRLILEESAGVLGIRDKMATAERRLEETSTNISRLSDVIAEATRQLNSLRIQAGRARNRETLKLELKEKESRLLRQERQALAMISTEKDDVIQREKMREAELLGALDLATAIDGEVRSRMLALDLEAQDLRQKIEQLREELEQRNNAKQMLNAQLQQFKALISAKENEIRRFEEQLLTLNSRSMQSNDEVETLSKIEAELVEKLSLCSATSSDSLRELSEKREETRNCLREAERSLATARETLAANEASISAKKEQLKAASPHDQLRKAMKSFDIQKISPLLGTDGEANGLTLADEIDVPQRYSRALQSILAERASFIVVEDIQAVVDLFADNRRTDAQAIGLLRAKAHVSLDETSGNTICDVKNGDTVEKPLINFTNEEIVLDHNARSFGLIPILSCFKCSSRVSPALLHILKDVYLSETRECAFYAANSETLSPQISIVTLDGEIITRDSFFSLKNEAGLVEIKTSLNSLQNLRTQVLSQKQLAEREREILSQKLKLLDEEHSQLLRNAQQQQIKEREIAAQLGNARGRLEAANRQTQQINQDSQRLVELKAQSKEKISHLMTQIVTLEDQIAKLDTQGDADLAEFLKSQRHSLDDLEKARFQKREELSQTSIQLVHARSALDEMRATISQAELEAQKSRLELLAIEERVLREYDEEMLSEIKLSAEPITKFELEQLATEVKKLRFRLVREGEVDPTAIQRFEEESLRFDQLEKQRLDLESAKVALEKTISTLRSAAESRFSKVFAAVSDNFSRLIPRLFGGGKGEIALLNPENPLNSGVEICVRPPGKKPKGIELLSGGEKALSATALIIAMFLVKPSPLCVLDEVDAPLDEANLERFLALVKEMSLKTQFVLITHNKASMTVCDTLVGVTQKEPGASHLISVSLQQAYQAVA